MRVANDRQDLRHPRRSRRAKLIISLNGGRELRSLAYAPFGARRGRAVRAKLFISLNGGRSLRSLAYAPFGARRSRAVRAAFAARSLSWRTRSSVAGREVNHFPQAPGAHSVRLAYAPFGARRGRAVRSASRPGTPYDGQRSCRLPGV